MKPAIRLLLRIAGWGAVVLVVLGVAGAIWASTLYSRYTERAAKYDLTKVDDLAERSAIYDGNGEFYSYFGGENRLVVPLEQVAQSFINALIAREDSRFWEHHGIDGRGVMRAAWTNFRAGETKQGASTLTQQLARNACGLGERSFDRKALEAVLAQRIEAQYSKQQILDFYVNRIYFGEGYYGIEAAARGYFGKPAAELTLSESATLAGLIRNPKRLSPARDMEAALAQRDAVLTRMNELRMISSEERAAAQAQQIQILERRALRVTDDAVTDAVLRELGTLLAPETLEFGGLKISMTIDPQMQELAQAVADRRLSEVEAQKNYPHPKKADFVPGKEGDTEKPTDYLQASVAVIENKTGAIKAVVGARDYAQSHYSRALLSKRQVGSTFKPFVYAAAFERGLLPGTQVDDNKIAAGEFAGFPKDWSPENSDGQYAGFQPASFGLLKSRNTMSIRVGEYASLRKVRELGQTVGLGDKIPELPVSFLGAFEATAKDLTAAYAVFPNQGVYRAPYLISKIEDREGRVLWEAKQEEKKVLSPESAWMVSEILQQTMKKGTASKSVELGWKKNGAGKTGTTNDFKDAWFVGYTDSLTCGVWVGLDQPQTITEKGYGSTLALPIWVDVMQQISEQRFPAPPMRPEVTLVKATLCSHSNSRATATCVAQKCAYEVALPSSRLPGDLCRTHPEVAPMPVATVPVPPPAVASGVYSNTYPSTTVPAVAAIPPATVASTVPSSGVIPRAEPVERPMPEPIAAGPNGARRERLVIPVPSAPARVAQRPRAAYLDETPGSIATMPPVPIRHSSSSTSTTSRVPETRVMDSGGTIYGVEEVLAPANTRVAPSLPMTTPVPKRVEVRRAIPVEPSPTRAATASLESANAVPTGNPDERQIVERTPDGRLRTTTIRTIRIPANGLPQEKVRVEKARKAERDDDDDD